MKRNTVLNTKATNSCTSRKPPAVSPESPAQTVSGLHMEPHETPPQAIAVRSRSRYKIREDVLHVFPTRPPSQSMVLPKIGDMLASYVYNMNLSYNLRKNEVFSLFDYGAWKTSAEESGYFDILIKGLYSLFPTNIVILLCFLGVKPTLVYLMQFPGSLHGSDNIISALHYGGWDVANGFHPAQ